MKYIQNGLLLALMIMLYSCGGTTEETTQTSTTDESSVTTAPTPTTETSPTEETPSSVSGEDEPLKLYVMAKSGLNLRESSDLKSKVIKKIPLGGLVTYHMDSPILEEQVIDGISGRMEKVRYENLAGFVFEGYLSLYPPTNEEETDGEYIKRLKKMKLITKGGTYRKEGDGYTEGRDSLFLTQIGMQEAFLIASHMHRYVAGYKYPGTSSKKEEVFENKDKPEFVFEDKMTVYRNDKGEIIRITHVNTNEIAGEEMEIILEKDGVWIKTNFGVS